MHVLLLNQFFYPDVSAVAQLATDLGEDLVAAGHRITAVAARGTYLGGTRLPQREVYNGIEIVRLRSTSLGKRNVITRLFDYGSFLASALLHMITSEKPDAVLVMSTPPFIATVAALAKLLRHVPYVYWAQDLYPDLAYEFGVIRRESLSARAFDSLATFVVRSARAIITLGDAMADRLVEKGATRDRLHIVPNWSDPDAIRPVPHEQNDFRKRVAPEGQRLVIYSGNMGRGHDIDTLLRAAECLRAREDVIFLFIGDGVQKRLVEQAARLNPRIRLMPYQERANLSRSLSAGDVHVVTQTANTLGLMEPSKLYGVMAVGRPVLYIGPVDTEVARTITRERLGAVLSNGDASGAAAALEHLFESAQLIGPRVRLTFEVGYARRVRTDRIGAILTSVVHGSVTTTLGPR